MSTQPSNQAADSHEIRPLTGIRGVAALLVMFLHFFTSWIFLLPALEWWHPLASRGNVGVDFFFILSGFILSYVYRAGSAELRPAAYGKFVWYRFARIFPNHLATLLVLLALVVVAARRGIALTGDYPLSGLPFQLAMIHMWPGVHAGAWNNPAWSISAEWFAYLFAFPLTWLVLKRRLGPVVCLVASYAALALWLFVFYDPDPARHPLFQVSCEFVTGAMLFGLHRQAAALTDGCQRYASVLAVLVLGLLVFCPADALWAMRAVILLFPLLLLGLTSERSRFSRLLSSPPALWLGRVSYALYMSHEIIRKGTKIVLPSERYADSPLSVRLLVLSINLVLILASAAGLYYLVEVPARNLLRRLALWWTHRAARLNAPTADPA